MTGHEKRPVRLLITGGGTGGHLFPAIATAQALRSRQPDSEVLFIGTRRKIDTTSLNSYGFKSKSIISYGLKGKNLAELIKALVILPVSIIQAGLHILRFRPNVALGVGGYVTGPVMLAAKLLRVPTIIHEQNSIPGLANRKLGKFVDHICISLPGSEQFFDKGKTLLTGNPVREDILDLSKSSSKDSGPLTLLVLGGSQGANALNRMVTEAFCDYGKEHLRDITVIHQTGQSDAHWVEERYQKAGVSAKVAPFFTDMSAVYREADLLISRAGATTLTELAVLGKPAVLVPYPHAADDHQKKNAAYYVDGGGAMQYSENDINGRLLSDTLCGLCADRSTLESMGDAMRSLAMPEAAEKIVDVCLMAARGGRATDNNSVQRG